MWCFSKSFGLDIFYTNATLSDSKLWTLKHLFLLQSNDSCMPLIMKYVGRYTWSL